MTTASPSADPVPLVHDLASIYPSSSSLVVQGKRWADLTSRFTAQYGSAPHFVARAPGRVNIIGEHIDHQGLAVLPAAIEKDVLMAVRVEEQRGSAHGRSSTVHVRLVNTTKRFAQLEFEADTRDAESVQLVHHGDTRWGNYFKVAFKGLLPHLPPSILATTPANISVLVTGSIPPESSLSSSAAMTVCSSIVVLQALGARELIGRQEMAEVAIESERLVGVASGGMDQAASIFGAPSHALHIAFKPRLAAVPTRLPHAQPEFVWVVVNTLVVSDKKVMGPVQYNLRVAELAMATHALFRALDLPLPASATPQSPPPTLYDLLAAYRAHRRVLPLDYPGVREALEKYAGEGSSSDDDNEAAWLTALTHEARGLPRGALPRTEVERLTGLAPAAFEAAFTSRFPIRAESFHLAARVQHVLSEALRVHEFRAACLAPEGGGARTYERLGALMDASQASLRDAYDASCAEINDVVSIARAHGAVGSRLTGAGWGGSTVHCVPAPDVERFTAAMRARYFAKRWPDRGEEEVADAILVTRPAGGACVYRVGCGALVAAMATRGVGAGAIGWCDYERRSGC